MIGLIIIGWLACGVMHMLVVCGNRIAPSATAPDGYVKTIPISLGLAHQSGSMPAIAGPVRRA